VLYILLAKKSGMLNYILLQCTTFDLQFWIIVPIEKTFLKPGSPLKTIS
uniref:Uncharacterized protein n=1 Tax=Amphimedon queenslandica TaxID=400682 RepID=A0A1X7UBJ2_AMPQE